MVETIRRRDHGHGEFILSPPTAEVFPQQRSAMKQQRVQNEALFTKQRLRKVRIDICIGIDTHLSHKRVEKFYLNVFAIYEKS